MPSLSIVPDSVVSPHADPVRNGAVLPLLLGQLLLDDKGLVRRHSCRCTEHAQRPKLDRSQKRENAGEKSLQKSKEKPNCSHPASRPICLQRILRLTAPLLFSHMF
eukprot:c16813_g1_i1 orf=238-555(+)